VAADRDGGYRIITTSTGGPGRRGAPRTRRSGQRDERPAANLQAALTAIEPNTGRSPPHGGHDGKGSDFAGIYRDDDAACVEGGQKAPCYAGFGAHPPGSSFKVYTLAAALNMNYSLDSYWRWDQHDMPGRVGQANWIRNASKCTVPGSQPAAPEHPCTLLNATTQSLNVPFYALTHSVTPAKVIEMARNAGIDFMWNERGRHELRNVRDMSEVTPSQFDTIVGIGQYPITVMDHANGVATMAAGGLRATAHFTKAVYKGNNDKNPVYSEKLPADNSPRISQPVREQRPELRWAESRRQLNNGWDSAGKTGTWEYDNRTDQNAHAWMVGYTKKIAAAVWVGNKAKPLKDSTARRCTARAFRRRSARS
jgi:membrane peptidoglycan carboxypeptidase